jgi:hypothetical protein
MTRVKKFILVFAVLLFGALCLSAGIRKMPAFFRRSPAKQSHCTGFTVVEATKGIDCNGDTVRLIKVNGFYAIAQ